MKQFKDSRSGNLLGWQYELSDFDSWFDKNDLEKTEFLDKAKIL
jgi:hypothetical protein